MKYGYARVSIDGQNVVAQVIVLRAAGAGQVFRVVAFRRLPPPSRLPGEAKDTGVP
jgi:hypothetical protein